MLYPVVIATLIGFALSRGPDKPQVAFANLVPESANEIELGGERIDLAEQAGRLFGAIEPVPGGHAEGGDPEGQGRRGAGGADHPRGHHPKAPVRARAGDRRGVLQRRGPGQGQLRAGHDQVAGAGRQHRAHQAADQGGARVPRPDRHGRPVQLPRPRRRHPRPRALGGEPREGEGRAAAAGRQSRAGDRQGDPASPSWRATTSTSPTTCWPSVGSPHPGEADRARRRHHAAQLVRRGARRGRVDHVHHAAAGRGRAGARAGGERVHAARARTRVAHRSCCWRRRAWRPSARWWCAC